VKGGWEGERKEEDERGDKLINTPNAARIEKDVRGVSREQMARFFPVAGPPPSLPPSLRLPPAAGGGGGGGATTRCLGAGRRVFPRTKKRNVIPVEKSMVVDRVFLLLSGDSPAAPVPHHPPEETSVSPPVPALAVVPRPSLFLANLRAHLGGAPTENRVASRALARTTRG